MSETLTRLEKEEPGSTLLVLKNNGKEVSGDLIKTTKKSLIMKVDGKNYPPILLNSISDYEVIRNAKDNQAEADKELLDSSDTKGITEKTEKEVERRTKVQDIADGKTVIVDKSNKTKDDLPQIGNSKHILFDAIKLKEGFNKRFVMGDIAALAASIATNGILSPLTVAKVKSGYEVVDGHRRYKALQHLRDKGVTVYTVPVILEDRKASEMDKLVHSYVHNTGLPFTPLEEATLFSELRDSHDLNVKGLAEHLGLTQSYIRRRLNVADHGCPALLEAVGEGMNIKTAADIATKAKGSETDQKKMIADVEGSKQEAKEKRLKLAKKKRIEKKREQREQKEKKHRAQQRFTINTAKALLIEVSRIYLKFARTYNSDDSEEVKEDAFEELAAVMKEIRVHKREGHLS